MSYRYMGDYSSAQMPGIILQKVETPQKIHPTLFTVSEADMADIFARQTNTNLYEQQLNFEVTPEGGTVILRQPIPKQPQNPSLHNGYSYLSPDKTQQAFAEAVQRIQDKKAAAGGKMPN